MRKKMMGILITVLLCCSNTLSQPVVAASYTLAWPLYLGLDYNTPGGSTYPTNEQGTITIEKGQKNFYIGDYVYETQTFQNLSRHSGVTYHSEDSSIVSVNRTTGYVEAKKTGKVILSIKYKKKETICTVKVVKKDSIAATKKIPSALKVNAQAAAQAYANKITEKNCYETVNAISKLERVLPKNKKIINQKGFACKAGHATQQLILPALGRYATIKQAIEQYAKKENPIGIKKNHTFKIKQCFGSKKNITIQLQKKVTQAQIFAIQKANKEEYPQKMEKAKFTMYVKELSGGRQHTARAEVTKGSDIIKVSLSQSLKKGHKYRLIGKETGNRSMKYGWTKGKIVNVR